MANTCVRLCLSKFYLNKSYSLLQISSKSTSFNFLTCRRTHQNSVSNEDQVKDIEKLFMNDQVQEILKRITGFDINKIFAPKPNDPVRSPKYQFMTDEDLKLARENAYVRGKEQLQMPPVKAQWNDTVEVLGKNPELQKAIRRKLIFVDISPGYSDIERLIVVREKNGLLRKANHEERYRMNQIFFPVEKRQLEMPKMFEEEHLEVVLNNQEYLFILDRACIQFEPDDPVYIRVTQRTYDHISQTNSFDILRSTRHFGPMAFYFAFYEKIDKLLLDCLQRELVNDAFDLVKLYYIIHPNQEYNNYKDDEKLLELVKFYIANESTEKHVLELAVQKLEQLDKEKRRS